MRAKPVEVKLEPLDNQRLARLCGALDENLRQIESALDVTIARRGARFTVRGEQAGRAAQALEHFYDRATGDLTVEDVQLGLTELSKNVSLEDQGPQLLTRRQDLHGRTPHQVQYIENILAHDLTFGIGPAGTGKTYLAVACAVDALERDKVKRIVLERVHRARHGEVGLAGARGADADGAVVGQDALDVLHLVRRAAVKVGAPREQLRAFRRLQKGVVRELRQAELHVFEREVARGAVVEMLQRLRRALRLLAAHRELAAAARDDDVERRLDLAPVLVQRSAEACEALVVDRLELDLDGLTCLSAVRRAANGKRPR